MSISSEVPHPHHPRRRHRRRPLRRPALRLGRPGRRAAARPRPSASSTRSSAPSSRRPTARSSTAVPSRRRATSSTSSSLEYAGNHVKHAKKASGTNHLRCTFGTAGPPDCVSHVAFGASMLVFEGFPGTLVLGTGKYLGATGRVLSNTTSAKQQRHRRPHHPEVGRVHRHPLGYGRGVPDYAITYGKTAVPVYRHGAAPLEGLAAIPESAFTGRETRCSPPASRSRSSGTTSCPSYTEGDNSMVVATDSIKNLVLRETGSWTGATLESLLHHLGGLLLADYPQIEALGMQARRSPSRPPGGVLFSRGAGDHATPTCAWSATATAPHRGPGLRPPRHGPAQADRQRLHGVRARRLHDPPRPPRPPALHRAGRGLALRRPADALGAEPARYVAAEQVRDLVAAVFECFVASRSSTS